MIKKLTDLNFNYIIILVVKRVHLEFERKIISILHSYFGLKNTLYK